MPKGTENMQKCIKILLSVFIIMTMLFCFFGCSCGDTTDNEIIPASLDILKIGKADCIIINTGSKIVMIDTGEAENYDIIDDYMSNKGYNTIDTLILTHYDKDHIGGASELILNYNVATVIESKFDDSTVEYINYHNTIYSQNSTLMKLTENYKFIYDSCEFEIDIPKKNKYEVKQDNNTSLIISMKCGEKRFLFCGDAMELRLEEFINEKYGCYDLAKLPYHGNYLENYRDFLSSTKISYGIITDSKKNPASNETLSLLTECGIATYQTRNGLVSISTDGKEIIIYQK